MKFEFIDGTIPPFADPFDPSFQVWNLCNMFVHSMILNFVSPSIAKFILFMENAMDVWINLKECFAQGDLVKSQFLLMDPLPPMNKIFPYNFVTWEERQFHSS
jgi:hypothetical protein